jgi:hypothetical protein
VRLVVEQVAATHALPFPVSEPEAFVEFDECILSWCVSIVILAVTPGGGDTPSGR